MKVLRTAGVACIALLACRQEVAPDPFAELRANIPHKVAYTVSTSDDRFIRDTKRAQRYEESYAIEEPARCTMRIHYEMVRRIGSTWDLHQIDTHDVPLAALDANSFRDPQLTALDRPPTYTLCAFTKQFKEAIVVSTMINGRKFRTQGATSECFHFTERAPAFRVARALTAAIRACEQSPDKQ
ncbi:MAG TPA: hypothetical protein VLU46_12035 [Thermoanaerobaculia bacterium]|nr:hypothetical protein [Thermoanaerobaculia bacterium]